MLKFIIRRLGPDRLKMIIVYAIGLIAGKYPGYLTETITSMRPVLARPDIKMLVNVLELPDDDDTIEILR